MNIEVPTSIAAPDPSGIQIGPLAKLGGALAVGGTALVAILLVMPFVVWPWAIKQFYPKWSYSKRVATGFGISFGVGALTGLARALGGRR